MLDDDLALLHPILNGVELDVEVAGASRWLAVIGKALGTFVVAKQGRGGALRDIDVNGQLARVQGDLGTGY